MKARLNDTTHRLTHWATNIAHRLDQVPPIHLALRTVKEMGDDDGTHIAAGVAYYSVLSLFPLILGLISVLSFFFNSETLQQELAEFLIDYLPGSGDFVDENIRGIVGLRGALGVVSILGLLWTGSAIFGAITKAVNRAWDIHTDRPFYIAKPRQIAMALGVGGLFLLSISATTALQILSQWSSDNFEALNTLNNFVVNSATRLLPLLFSLMIFLLIYKFIPNTTTSWRFIWPGALLAAILFEVSKNIFVLYLARLANYASVYGSIGSVIVLMVWTYLSALILILGAEFASEYGRMRHGVDRGVPIAVALKEFIESEGDVV